MVTFVRKKKNCQGNAFMKNQESWFSIWNSKKISELHSTELKYLLYTTSNV
jgi:hypothetical protein